MADCRVFDVYRDICVDADTEESEATFYRLECPDWCNIVALTKTGEIVLVEQFRQGAQAVGLEIPGGVIDDGEEPATAAARELLEETGFKANAVVSLGTAQPNPAIQNNRVHLFLAKDCEKTAEPHFDSHEHLITKLVPVNEIKNLIESGAITHSLCLNGLLRFLLHENLL